MSLKLNANGNVLMGTAIDDVTPQFHYSYSFMISSKLRAISTNSFCSTAITGRIRAPKTRASKVSVADQLKQNWLDSLTYPPLHDLNPTQTHQDSSKWVLGVDPDLSGALAVLKTDNAGSSAQVFDTPQLPVLVGGRVRKRLDAKSIVVLLRGLDAPVGTTAYIEQSIPYPKDGKQGWWSGGFGYGLWIGILVASGFSVVPVPSLMWKSEFELTGGTSTKDDSRRLASTLFPSLSSLLKRKKDHVRPVFYIRSIEMRSKSAVFKPQNWHGRAEALLIAAYGKGVRVNSSNLSEALIP